MNDDTHTADTPIPPKKRMKSDLAGIGAHTMTKQEWERQFEATKHIHRVRGVERSVGA